MNGLYALFTIASILCFGRAFASSGWYLNDLPANFQASTFEKKRGVDGAGWAAKICFDVYNRNNPGDTQQTLPTKKKEGDITQRFFNGKAKIDSAGVRVDWEGLPVAKIHWFDSSFAVNADGTPKGVQVDIRRVLFEPDFKGYEICMLIPYKDASSYDYVKRKMSAKNPLGIVVWKADFIIDYFQKGKKVGDQRYAIDEIVTPVFGLTTAENITFTADVRDIYNQINIVKMLRVADDTIDANSIEDFMKVKSLRWKKKRVQKECGELPTESLDLFEFTDDLKKCVGG